MAPLLRRGSHSTPGLRCSPPLFGRIHRLPDCVFRFPSFAPRNGGTSISSPIPSRPVPDTHLCRSRVFIAPAEGEGRHVRLDQEGKEDLGQDGEVFRKTLRLVECAMLASVAGLAYILSNTLAVESYFGCFFSLPIVISSMRWGVAAGRKTTVATAMLLFILSGPVKATTYLLMHGLLGLVMGSLWRLGVNWGLSIILCTFVRMLGAVGYVLVSSFLIRENILSLIAINIHASMMNTFASVGINTFLSMNTIYAIFSFILMLNCAFFVLLLHILYAVFLAKLGMTDSLDLPRWLRRAV